MKYDPAPFAAASQSKNKGQAATVQQHTAGKVLHLHSQINWNRSLHCSQPVEWQRDLYQLWIRSGSIGIEPWASAPFRRWNLNRNQSSAAEIQKLHQTRLKTQQNLWLHCAGWVIRSVELNWHNNFQREVWAEVNQKKYYSWVEFQQCYLNCILQSQDMVFI